jgi:DNA-binding NtrC family response regulator
MKKKKILFVEDDPEMRDLAVEFFLSAGYNVAQAVNGTDAVEQIAAEDFDAVITDLKMQEMDGLALLREIHIRWPDLPVILITAFGTIETAVEAVKEGAANFIPKPFKMQVLKTIVDKAILQKWLTEENQILKDELQERYSFFNLIGKSKAMQQVYELIRQVGVSPSNVMIEGESGTGKELVARALHTNSARASHPFVALNCSALPETLLESELFGYVKGAFTDARTSKAGLFEEADGGTLFLDEISSMPLGLQAKMLRAIQDGEIRPLGQTQSRRVDVRIITATNQDVEREVELGHFREDLYYRLNVIRIYLPPLRDRREDIPLLAVHFLNHYARLNHKNIPGFDPEALSYLVNASWRGNVRELENAIERAVVLCKGEMVTSSDLMQIRQVGRRTRMDGEFIPLRQLEELYIKKILDAVHGNKEQAARILGVSSRTLYRRFQQREPKSVTA